MSCSCTPRDCLLINRSSAELWPTAPSAEQTHWTVSRQYPTHTHPFKLYQHRMSLFRTPWTYTNHQETPRTRFLLESTRPGGGSALKQVLPARKGPFWAVTALFCLANPPEIHVSRRHVAHVRVCVCVCVGMEPWACHTPNTLVQIAILCLRQAAGVRVSGVAAKPFAADIRCWGREMAAAGAALGGEVGVWGGSVFRSSLFAVLPTIHLPYMSTNSHLPGFPTLAYTSRST